MRKLLTEILKTGSHFFFWFCSRRKILIEFSQTRKKKFHSFHRLLKIHFLFIDVLSNSNIFLNEGMDGMGAVVHQASQFKKEKFCIAQHLVFFD